MDASPLKILQHVRRRVQAVTYGSAFYRMMLDQGPFPDRLRLTLSDPWPGDARHGAALIAGTPGLFENGKKEAGRDASTFSLLRDLRAVGSPLAQRKAIALIHEWLEEQALWSEEEWGQGVLGARLANWIAFYDFYAPAASYAFIQTLIAGMVRQLRHLLHALPAPFLTGVPSLYAIKGLVYGGLALIDGQKALGLALDLLRRQLEEEVLPDGGTVFRNPTVQAEMLRQLIDIRAALRAGQMDVPPDLHLAIVRMASALKVLRHGDGGLALFNGGREGASLILDAAQTFSESRARAAKRLPYAGYERLSAGRSLLLVDVALPPPRPYDEEAHAGLASFEFSVGKERILTNCGAAESSSDPSWRQALAATAAHNAVTVEDTNACEVLEGGGIGHRPRALTSQRYEQEGVHTLEVLYERYQTRHPLALQRVLTLSADGEQLRGREVLTGAQGLAFALRWHIHPAVTALLAQGGESALLRTASGSGWRFRLAEGAGAVGLGLEPSIYCGGGAARRTLQLFVTGRTLSRPTVVEWSLTREKTKKGT